MPPRKCSNGKWSIGGQCMYKSKKKALKAYKAYLYKTGKKWGEELDPNMTLGEIQAFMDSMQSEAPVDPQEPTNE